MIRRRFIDNMAIWPAFSYLMPIFNHRLSLGNGGAVLEEIENR